jgi:hypothetical protein
VAALLLSTAARAFPLYSFETLYNNNGEPDPTGTRPDNFTVNGGGTTLTQDTIGATDGTHSIKYAMVQGAFFTGGITTTLAPNITTQNAVSMDVTIPAGGAFTGNFANLGISMFGDNAPMNLHGLQVQTIPANEARIKLDPGTYKIGVPLIAIGNPITFDPNVPFTSIFGSDPNTQLTPVSWEFYINKSTDAALTVYIDNIRMFQLMPGDANVDGKVDTLDFNALAGNFGGTGKVWRNADFNNDGTVDTLDFNSLAANFGKSANPPPGDGGGGAGALVPEPSTLMLACGAAGLLICRRRRR